GFLGDAVFSPAQITSGQTSTLRAFVATTSSVPAGIKAILSLSEVSNAKGITYLTTSQEIAVTLEGHGHLGSGEVTFTVPPSNTGLGRLLYQVSLVRLENVPANSNVTLMQRTQMDATLTVIDPTAAPTPTSTGPSTSCSFQDCEVGYAQDASTCECMPVSTIIIDTKGDGIALTSAQNGVKFNIDTDTYDERVAWTTANSDDAFLFLDRNENELVDSGLELFGNFTPQQYSPTPNGFVALAWYDKPEHGGNGDGIIGSSDDVYSQLKLWRDLNHNGISERNELSTLPELGVNSISLAVEESKQTDQFGNKFRYRAKVEDTRHSRAARWAREVILVSSQ
ncbi:MAG: hypothetical protein ACRD63_04030, partial [Pyrinomonadaceae bacterium]